MSIEIMEDKLWNNFRSGEKAAFEKIYVSNFKLLYNYGRQFTTDSDLVNDSIQELFVDLWDSKFNLGPTDSIKFYLMRSFRRKLAKKINYHSRHLSLDFNCNTGFELLSPHESDLINADIDQENKVFLEEGFKILSKRKREVLFLKYYSGLDNNEIADVLSIKIKTVYNLVFDSLEVLRKQTRAVFRSNISRIVSALITSAYLYIH
ncbi:MAG: sigma-70 family RNA polymerase sigma factor [Reichenbachiella sp.]|uniref:RNA polymerase sigma factor n=2 Tax=Reichenbachiella sp. TaxID=2184521 RepID=UPI0032634432